MREHLPTYKAESLQLFKLFVFNYLFSNGDAHLKNFSILETALGDYRLSPTYDLLNSRYPIDDKDFALEDGLLPARLGQGNVSKQFQLLAGHAGIPIKQYNSTMHLMISKSDQVSNFIEVSFLKERIKRSYLQSYQLRLKKLKE